MFIYVRIKSRAVLKHEIEAIHFDIWQPTEHLMLTAQNIALFSKILTGLCELFFEKLKKNQSYWFETV